MSTEHVKDTSLAVFVCFFVCLLPSGVISHVCMYVCMYVCIATARFVYDCKATPMRTGRLTTINRSRVGTFLKFSLITMQNQIKSNQGYFPKATLRHTGRIQRVKLRSSNTFSDWIEITAGMPQGTWLGPLTFCYVY